MQLKFKKLGNHWYLDIPHENPQDLKLEKKVERLLNRLNIYNDDILDRICLVEKTDIGCYDFIIQFSEEDLLRYFTTKDVFFMKIYIGHHIFNISSNLYTLLENHFHFQFHLNVYELIIF